MLSRTLLIAGAGLLAAPARAQQPPASAATLGELVQGIGNTARVLMIGAHPDDEDTQLIAWLARGRHVETAYLSLTRGDGGQNLIGNELGATLGMIRTEELLAARRIDGGRQYFTRAYDFGFSKTLEETMQRWPRDSILRDMVAIVRAFRPHVIIDVWSGTPADGHGHHQYAGVLGREVFDAAADSIRFPPSSVGGLRPWRVAKFYRGRPGSGATLTMNVGEYDPLTGRTLSELATISRSQHRSQGQGDVPQRGPRLDGVKLEASRLGPIGRETDLFAGLDTSWGRFGMLQLPDSARAALDSIPFAARAARQDVDLMKPSRMVEPLATVVRLLSRASTAVTCAPLGNVDSKKPACDATMGDLALALASNRERASQALVMAAGVAIEATTTRELVAEGDTVPVTVSVFNQGELPVTLERATLLGQPAPDATAAPRVIAPDSSATRTLTFRGRVVSSPWWLRQERHGDLFTQPLAEMVMGEDRLFDSGVDVQLGIGDVSVPVRVAPIVYRKPDAVLGEVRRPLATVPEISVVLEREVEYARADVPFDRTFRVLVRSGATAPRDVAVSLTLPAGLSADSQTKTIRLPAFGNANLYFRLRGRLTPGHDSIVATATSGGRSYQAGFVPVEYEHIRPLRAFRRSAVQLEAVRASFASTLRVGYIRGVGDNVMPMLAQLGIPVTELDPADLPRTRLAQFTTIVLGPRAYQANPAAMAANTPLLMKFVRDGGTIVAQYGQQEMAQPGVLPFAITLARTAERVTDETTPVRVLDPGSPLLSTPNKITQADFGGWVQERALYLPSSFDAQWRPLLAMNDPGAPPNDAAVLVAPVGSGVYVYTTLSFFRQLPAGNPGAARLFINLLSANRLAAARPAVRRSTPP